AVASCIPARARRPSEVLADLLDLHDDLFTANTIVELRIDLLRHFLEGGDVGMCHGLAKLLPLFLDLGIVGGIRLALHLTRFLLRSNDGIALFLRQTLPPALGNRERVQENDVIRDRRIIEDLDVLELELRRKTPVDAVNGSLLQ